MPRKTMIQPRSTFTATVARAGLSLRELARKSEVPHQTLYGILHPEHNKRRRGNIAEKTAWKLAKGLAAETGQTEESAFEALFTMSETAPQQDHGDFAAGSSQTGQTS